MSHEGLPASAIRLLHQVIARSEANEALSHPGPWVIMSVDPTIEGPRGVSLIGPFDDFLLAMRAAEVFAENLNRGLGPDDEPWRTHVMPLWANDLEVEG